jgi:hypothetical protein
VASLNTKPVLCLSRANRASWEQGSNFNICGDTSTRPRNDLHESGQRMSRLRRSKCFFMLCLQLGRQLERVAVVSA